MIRTVLHVCKLATKYQIQVVQCNFEIEKGLMEQMKQSELLKLSPTTLPSSLSCWQKQQMGSKGGSKIEVRYSGDDRDEEEEEEEKECNGEDEEEHSENEVHLIDME